MLSPDRLPDLTNADESLRRRGRFLTTTMLLDLEEVGYLIHIREGRVESVRPEPAVMPVWTFAVRAPADEWSGFFAAKPKPGSHDIMALMRRRVLTVEGEIHSFMSNLQYFKDLLAALRDRDEGQ